MLSRLQNTESQGRLVIDLNQILNDAEHSDLLVKDLDSLIPSIPYAVSVSMRFNFLHLICIMKKLDLDDYSNRSGGYTQNVDKRSHLCGQSEWFGYSKEGNGWFGKGSNGSKISPGDVIVALVDIKNPFS